MTSPKQHLVSHAGGSGYASNKDGGYVTLQKGGVFLKVCINSGINNSKKYWLKGMQHKKANMYVARR